MLKIPVLGGAAGAVSGAMGGAVGTVGDVLGVAAGAATDRLKKEVESLSADPLAHARRRAFDAVVIAEQVVERVAASAPVLASDSQRLLAENSELFARQSSLGSNGSLYIYIYIYIYIYMLNIYIYI